MVAGTYTIERKCGHSESKWITGAYQADIEWKIETLQSRDCSDCVAPAKGESNKSQDQASRSIGNCRRYTRGQGCPDHGELCSPDYR